MTKKVLLVCGAGASSGFMAAAARKAAKKNSADIEFKAKSESEINAHLDTIDLLLVAPHLKYMIEDVKDACEKAGVKYGVIPQKVYGALDGKGLVKVAEEHLQGGEQ
ncbi:PTS sugar transporter subunit IIB [Virgibacillus halophilus]|uniref:PTS sugar transporter subunit IIB n=1 Tax=Tigheibacillus halophilus TaxID=361280 RepID=UPI0036401943